MRLRTKNRRHTVVVDGIARNVNMTPRLGAYLADRGRNVVVMAASDVKRRW